jgi:hypothetical protein
VFAAIGTMTRGDGPALDDPSGLGVSRLVGALLVPLVLLILGIWFLQKPAPRDPD